MAESTRAAVAKRSCFHKEKIKYGPEEEARLEREHFWRIIDAFCYYRYKSLNECKRVKRRCSLQLNRFSHLCSVSSFRQTHFCLNCCQPQPCTRRPENSYTQVFTHFNPVDHRYYYAAATQRSKMFLHEDVDDEITPEYQASFDTTFAINDVWDETRSECGSVKVHVWRLTPAFCLLSFCQGPCPGAAQTR